MFRHDFEFVDGHLSHLEGATAPARPETAVAVTAGAGGPAGAQGAAAGGDSPRWSAEGEAELAKIPFFVRGKVRRNTEAFARAQGLAEIDSEALYAAKAHYSR
jgi:light-independent protochlorophyllide reductase subunit B